MNGVLIMANNIKGINHVGLTVPNIEEATEFFKNAFGAKIAYDGLSYDDDPRQGEEVERMLGLSEGTKVNSNLFLNKHYYFHHYPHILSYHVFQIKVSHQHHMHH